MKENAKNVPSPEAPATVEDLLQVKQKILREIANANKKSRRWEASLLVLQLVLTSGLGYLVWRVQADIDQRISEEGLRLSARLALTQDFYKKRLKVYSGLHKSCLQLKAAVRQLRVNPGARPVLTDGIAKLYENYSSNSLYLSSGLRQELDALWLAAIECSRAQPLPPELVKRTILLAESVETKMRQDLFVDSMSDAGRALKISGEKEGS